MSEKLQWSGVVFGMIQEVFAQKGRKNERQHENGLDGCGHWNIERNGGAPPGAAIGQVCEEKKPGRAS